MAHQGRAPPGGQGLAARRCASGSTTSSTTCPAPLLHVPASDRLQKACRQATGIKPSEIIDPEHELVAWGMGRLLTTFLDSPEFMSR